MTRTCRRASGHFSRDYSNWDGRMAKTFASIFMSAQQMPTVFADMRRELVALAPDVILATGAAAVAPLLKATRTVPIVFTNVVDPVGAGFVVSLARPGGNATGSTTFVNTIGTVRVAFSNGAT